MKHFQIKRRPTYNIMQWYMLLHRELLLYGMPYFHVYVRTYAACSIKNYYTVLCALHNYQTWYWSLSLFFLPFHLDHQAQLATFICISWLHWWLTSPSVCLSVCKHVCCWVLPCLSSCLTTQGLTVFIQAYTNMYHLAVCSLFKNLFGLNVW